MWKIWPMTGLSLPVIERGQLELTIYGRRVWGSRACTSGSGACCQVGPCVIRGCWMRERGTRKQRQEAPSWEVEGDASITENFHVSMKPECLYGLCIPSGFLMCVPALFYLSSLKRVLIRAQTGVIGTPAAFTNGSYTVRGERYLCLMGGAKR